MVVNVSKIYFRKKKLNLYKKILKSSFIVFTIIGLVFVPEFSIFAAAPTVVTNAATNITKNNATITGTIVSDGGEVVTATGFEFGTTLSYGQNISGTETYIQTNSFGSQGSGDTQFDSPRGIDIDSSGNIYVVDTGNDRIKKYNSSYVWQSNISGSVPVDVSLSEPLDVSVLSDDSIVVLDRTAGTDGAIIFINSSGNFTDCFGLGVSCSQTRNYSSSLRGISSDSSNNIYYSFSSLGGSYVIGVDNSANLVYGALGGVPASGDGFFGYPNGGGGIYVDSLNNVYAIDSANNRIQKFDSTENFVFSIGKSDETSGTGEGEFDSPRDVYLDSDGNIFVTDAGNNRIQKFDSSGNFVTEFGTLGTGSNQLNTPVGLVVDSSDDLLVVDSQNHRVVKYEKGFETDLSAVVPSLTCGTTYYYRAYATNASGTSYGAGQSFTTLDCDIPLARTRSSSSVTETSVILEGSHEDQGALSVTSRGFNYGTSVSYGSTASQSGDLFIDEFGGSGGGGGNGTFLVLNTAGTDIDGNVYTTDQFEDVVQKFDSDGNFVSQYNVSSPAPGGVTTPSSVKGAPDGKLYIVDYINSKIIRFDDNNFTNPATFAAGAGLSSPTDIAFDSSGNVYVADYGNNRVVKLNSSGAVSLEIGEGAGSADGEFSNPVSVGLDSSGNVYVVDAGNSRVQKFDSSGVFVDKVGSSGSADGEFAFSTFSFLAVDNDDYVYVADTSNNRIQKFDSNLNYLSSFGTSGTGDGEFSSPASVAIGVDGDIFVSDSSNNRIQKFNEIFSASISGLSCGTTYHYRAFATNADGTDTGDDATFTTSACPPGSSSGGGSTGTKLPYVKITNDEKETKTKSISLDVYAPNLVESFSLSNTLDFSKKIDFKNNGGVNKIDWDLCMGLSSCLAGKKMVYAKFYYKDGSEDKESQTSILYVIDKTCPYFNGYAKKGDKNNKKEEVVKIQEFLNSELNAGLVIDGIFGIKTDVAVKAFQQKYFNEVITPWQNLNGLDKPTGWWYKTTSAWANTLLGCETKAKI